MSELFKNIVRLPPPHTARSYSQLTPVYTADEVAKTVASFEAELAKANERVKELEKEQLPIENGKNRYGLDVSYFRNLINRELNRPLTDYKPDELARVFARMSRTADDSVMFEPEFSSKFAIEQKRKSVSELNAYFVNRANRECEMLPIYFPDWCNDFREQLRKEQE